MMDLISPDLLPRLVRGRNGARRLCIMYNGVRYYRHPDSPHHTARCYYKSNGRVDGRTVTYLHRQLWMDEHECQVPEGHGIYYIDRNPDNIAPGNLGCLPMGDISRQYWAERRAEREALPRPARPAREAITQACVKCGVTYIPLRRGGRFCSSNCLMADRYARGVDREERVCAGCGVTFSVHKYTSTRHCSNACAQRTRRTAVAGKQRAGTG